MRVSPLLAAAVLFFAEFALAQQPSPNDDPIGRNLFPPELVMSHQGQIGLSDSQAMAIRNEIVKTQTKFVELQWQMQRESEKLEAALQQTPVNETQALAVAEKLMSLETSIKKTHLALLIRIKNALTDEQRTKLNEIRKSSAR